MQGVGENDFKAAMDAVDQQYLNDIISSNDNQSEASSADVSVKDDGTTEEDVPVSVCFWSIWTMNIIGRSVCTFVVAVVFVVVVVVLLLLRSPAWSLGFTILGEIFAYVAVF